MLAEGSERLASSLDDRMEITAYFTEDLPAPFNATARQVRDLLDELGNLGLSDKDEDDLVDFMETRILEIR